MGACLPLTKTWPGADSALVAIKREQYAWVRSADAVSVSLDKISSKRREDFELLAASRSYACWTMPSLTTPGVAGVPGVAAMICLHQKRLLLAPAHLLEKVTSRTTSEGPHRVLEDPSHLVC